MSTSTRFRWLTAGIASLATAAVLASAGVAAAGTVQAVAPPAGVVQLRLGFWLNYTAGAGVANEVTLTGTLDPVLYVHDEKATIKVDVSAQPYCVQVDARSVRCRGLSWASVALGDGNDLFTYQGYGTLSASGGAGDDQLTSYSSGGTARFDGGPGRDVCAGRIDVKVNCEA